MSQISDPSNAVLRIAQLLKDSDDPDDPGWQTELGDALLKASAIMAKKVRQTNKACKGSVTVKFELLGKRTPNKEVAIEISVPEPAVKVPSLAKKRTTQLFAGHDGELSTTAVQEEMPLFTKETARVVPGVGNDDAANAATEGKKGKKAL